MTNIGGLERALDRIVHDEAAGMRSRGRVEGMEAQLTPAGPLAQGPTASFRGMGSFSGWSDPVTAKAVLAGKLPRGYSPTKEERRLYRIQILGQPKATKAFYIGMVKKGDVRSRLRDHIRDYAPLKATDPEKIQVRVGRVLFPRTVDMKLLHFYELYLQMRERPTIYNPDTWTFEDFEEMWEEGNNRD